MSKPTQKQKELYKKLSPIVGIDSKVIKYSDDDNQNSIFLMECPDPTDDEVIFYSTIGLMDYPIEEKKYEVFLTGYRKYDFIGNILSTIAFFVMKNNWKLSIGTVYETLINMYYSNSEMQHVYFTTPYIWEDKLEGFKVQNEKISFLLGIPISEKESEYKKQNGVIALEDLFEENNIDIFDLDRESVV